MTLATPQRPRCRAHSKRTGEQCQQWPMHGGFVCQAHGGRAPQVKRAAAERIAEMVDPALNALRKLIDEADSDSVRLSAIRDILDRHMGRAQQRVDVTSDGQSLIKRIVAEDAELLGLPEAT